MFPEITKRKSLYPDGIEPKVTDEADEVRVMFASALYFSTAMRSLTSVKAESATSYEVASAALVKRN